MFNGKCTPSLYSYIQLYQFIYPTCCQMRFYLDLKKADISCIADLHFD